MWHEDDFMERRGKPIDTQHVSITPDVLRNDYVELLKKFTETRLRLEDAQTNDDAKKIASSFNSVYRLNTQLVDSLFKLIDSV
jgi:hypothetical protein